MNIVMFKRDKKCYHIVAQQSPVCVSIEMSLLATSLTGTNSLIFQHRMGKRDSLTQDDTAIEGNNLSGLDVHKMVSSREGIDKRESFEVPMDTNNNERIKRSSHSGYVRFGKRFSPLIEGLQGHHNIER